MTEESVTEGTAEDLALTDGDRLSLGVAARLSRYLQVLIQARKMGKETISSQELAEYTHINSTQIRRDLSGFGKFGKQFGEVEVHDVADLSGVVEEQDVVVGVLAVPSDAAQDVADRLVDAGVKI